MHIRNILFASGAGLVLSLSFLPAAEATSRYSTPPRAVLSGDLASPWILQLNNRSAHDQRGTSRVLRGQMPRSVLEAPARRQVVQPAPRPAMRNAAIEPAPIQSAPVQKAPERGIDPKYLPQLVIYESNHKPGTIVVDTDSRFLYLVEEDGLARRYGVGVGREGFEWRGTHKVTRRAEWPDWRPPAEMRERERKKGRELPVMMEGGPENPLGARALYIGDTLYRIHGTNQPWSIGQAVSSGCIRMRNEDVIDLYERVKVGARVVVS